MADLCNGPLRRQSPLQISGSDSSEVVRSRLRHVRLVTESACDWSESLTLASDWLKLASSVMMTSDAAR